MCNEFQLKEGTYFILIFLLWFFCEAKQKNRIRVKEMRKMSWLIIIYMTGMNHNL